MRMYAPSGTSRIANDKISVAVNSAGYAEVPNELVVQPFLAGWMPTPVGSPYILAQSAVPIILLPAGVWNNTTGQMAVGTALPYLPTGVCLVYLFASGIAQAGLYRATFSGTPAAPVVQIVGNPATVAGAYTPTTGVQVVLANVTMPGGSMGENGGIRMSFLSGRNAAGTSNVNEGFFVGGQDIASFSGRSVANLQGGNSRILRNRGVQNSQVTTFYTSEGSTSATGPQRFNIDTSIDTLVQIRGSLLTATDLLIIEGYTIEVLPMP